MSLKGGYSLSDAPPEAWARMRASTQMRTYACLDALHDADASYVDLVNQFSAEIVDDMILGGWVVNNNGRCSITENGRRER